MSFHNHINKQNLGLLGTIVGSLMIGIPAVSLPATAETLQTSSDPNYMSEAYCPGVYISSEEAYNQTDLSRCPLSSQELRLREQRQLAAEENGTTNFENRTNDIQPSLSEDTPNQIDRTTTGDFEDLSAN